MFSHSRQGRLSVFERESGVKGWELEERCVEKRIEVDTVNKALFFFFFFLLLFLSFLSFLLFSLFSLFSLFLFFAAGYLHCRGGDFFLSHCRSQKI